MFLRSRPELLSSIPTDLTQRGRAWPSPRSWEQVIRLSAAADAAGAPRSVRATLVAAMVGDAPATEFARFEQLRDLPDPELLLRRPDKLLVDMRSDLLLATLGAIVTAVAGVPTFERWTAAWDILERLCDSDRGDLAAMTATELVALREPSWPVPAAAAAFVPLLRDAALL
jgi:hypothetical protein